MWAIHLPNVRLTFWGVTISLIQIPDVLVRVHVMQCHIVLLGCFDTIFSDLDQALASSHICVIISKGPVKLKLVLPRIIYKSQSQLIRNQCET
jgi:hypothetical protein